MASTFADCAKETRITSYNVCYTKLLRQVDMEFDDEAKVRVVVHHLGGEAAALAEYLQPLAEQAGISLFLQSGRKETLRRVSGEEDLHIHPLGAGRQRLAYGPGGFAQVNLAQNRTRITSYNVCYTKLLRRSPSGARRSRARKGGRHEQTSAA